MTDARTRRSVLVGATMGNMIGLTPAVHGVFGMFLIPLSQEFGWSRASISGGLGLLAVVSVIVYPLVGRYVDRHGAWHVALIGNVLFASVLAAMAMLTGPLWQFYLGYFLIAIFAALLSPTLFLKMVVDTYRRDFGFAVGFAGGAGNGLGAGLIPMFAALVLTAYGWRAAYVGIGAIVLLIGLPTILLLLRSARQPARPAANEVELPGLSLAQLVRTPVFWLIFIPFAMMAGTMVAIFGHVIPILAERGINLTVATAALGACALVSPIWQPTMGWLIDRFGTPRIILPPYLAALAGIVVLGTAQGGAMGLAGGVLLGLGTATQFSVMPLLVVRYLGIAGFGATMGVMYAGMFLGQGVTPVLLDMIYDAQGSYRLALIGTGAFILIGAGLASLLPPFRAGAQSPARFAATAAH